MSKCAYFRRLIPIDVDEELNYSGKTELKEHLNSCEGCRQFYNEFLQFSSDISGSLSGRASDAPEPELYSLPELNNAVIKNEKNIVSVKNSVQNLMDNILNGIDGILAMLSTDIQFMQARQSTGIVRIPVVQALIFVLLIFLLFASPIHGFAYNIFVV